MTLTASLLGFQPPKSWQKSRRMSLPLNVEELESHRLYLNDGERARQTARFNERRTTLTQGEALWFM